MEISVLTKETQIVHAYPVIKQMLALRGFDVSEVTPVTMDTFMGGESDIATIRVQENSATPVPAFSAASPEITMLRDFLDDSSTALPSMLHSAFTKRYPAFAGYVSRIKDDCANVSVKKIQAILDVYKKISLRIAEVNFEQCFVTSWMPNQRDGGGKFMNDMANVLQRVDMESHAIVEPKLNALELEGKLMPEEEEKDAMHAELLQCGRRHRTIIYMYRTTRNKTSARLDEKYEKYCDRLARKDHLQVQLFNLRQLMFNVTEHRLVPKHEVLDVWRDREEIEEIHKTYNMKTLAELPIIASNDPVAKFIGIRKGDVCKITRINQGVGTVHVYRVCR